MGFASRPRRRRRLGDARDGRRRDRARGAGGRAARLGGDVRPRAARSRDALRDACDRRRFLRAGRRVAHIDSATVSAVATRETAYTPRPLDFAHVPPERALHRSRGFLELMQTRRSVRHFSDAPVEWELIENALRTAGTAPSGANQQPWTFVVVSDSAVKAQIREAAEHEERLLYEERASRQYLHAIEPIGTDAVKPHITDAPYVIVVFEQSYGFNADGTKRKHYYVRESVGIATGFLLASLHAAGLATLTHSPAPMGFLTRILDRPANERPFILIPVGYPADEAEVPSLTKKSLDEIAHLI
ncbi:MAG: nitroreductase family protein [Acidobacteria bacterium]|nr:nitroreductase family protein [Acidobacteriota bacterium]